MNLTDGANFPTPMIKRAKTRVNQKINLPCDAKRRIQEIAINNSWNTQIVQILGEIRDGHSLFKEKFLNRLPKPVELTYEWIKKIFKDKEPEFYSRLFDESENGPFGFPLGFINTRDKENRTRC